MPTKDEACQGPVEAFMALLRQERWAARRADSALLERLQADKRALLPALQAASLSDKTRQELSREARRNVLLVRHLVDCLAGMCGQTVSRATYDALGRPGQPSIQTIRGQL